MKASRRRQMLSAGPADARAAIERRRRGSYIAGMDATPAQASSPTAPSAAQPDAQPAPLLPILMPPNPVLRAKARKAGPEDDVRIRALVPQMLAAMYAAPGIGLAAPQVGVNLRLAVVDLHPDDAPAPIVLVNPEVIRVSEDWAVREEGCLSLPGMYADVSRPARVAVRYWDLDGKPHELEADGLMAACLQHEIDHLDGVLFVDHLSALKRNMLLRKLAKELKSGAKPGPAD